MRISTAVFTLLAAIALAGCRSRVVKVNLTNTSAAPISTIIVDYPSATFGKDKLAPGETFSYAIKPLETGELKIQFTDAKGARHTYTGSPLHKDDEGEIDVRLTQEGATAAVKLNTYR